MRFFLLLLLCLPFVLAHETPEEPVIEHETILETVWHYLETNGIVVFGTLFLIGIGVLAWWIVKQKS